MDIQLKPLWNFPSNIFSKYLMIHSPKIQNFKLNHSIVSKSRSIDLEPIYLTSPQFISNTYLIFHCKTYHSKPYSFLGIFLDTEAENSVVGTKQAKVYYREVCRHTVPTRIYRQFPFGDVVCYSYGTVAVRLPLREGAFLSSKSDIVSVEIPNVTRFGCHNIDSFSPCLWFACCQKPSVGLVFCHDSH